MLRVRPIVLALSWLGSSAVIAMSGAASASIVVAQTGGDAHVSESRVAFASSPSRTVSWEQLVLDEARGDLIWLVEVPRGGWIEGADAGWFEALDAVSAPVLAPAKSLGCGLSAHESTTMPPPENPARTVDR